MKLFYFTSLIFDTKSCYKEVFCIQIKGVRHLNTANTLFFLSLFPPNKTLIKHLYRCFYYQITIFMREMKLFYLPNEYGHLKIETRVKMIHQWFCVWKKH